MFLLTYNNSTGMAILFIAESNSKLRTIEDVNLQLSADNTRVYLIDSRPVPTGQEAATVLDIPYVDTAIIFEN